VNSVTELEREIWRKLWFAQFDKIDTRQKASQDHTSNTRPKTDTVTESAQSRHRGTRLPGPGARGHGASGASGANESNSSLRAKVDTVDTVDLHKLHIVTPLYTFYFTQHQNLKGVPRRQFMQFIVNLKTLKARCVQVCMNIKQRKWIEDGSELHILRNSASLRHCSNRSGLQLAASSFHIFSRFFQRYLMLPHVSSSCCLMSVMCRLCICTFGTFGTFGTFP
jgi:acyl carrier protein phosphodiesterase